MECHRYTAMDDLQEVKLTDGIDGWNKVVVVEKEMMMKSIANAQSTEVSEYCTFARLSHYDT